MVHNICKGRNYVQQIWILPVFVFNNITDSSLSGTYVVIGFDFQWLTVSFYFLSWNYEVIQYTYVLYIEKSSIGTTKNYYLVLRYKRHCIWIYKWWKRAHVKHKFLEQNLFCEYTLYITYLCEVHVLVKHALY
jgi:hypothetical protein